MICVSADGYRLAVSPSGMRDRSKCSMACRNRRSSPATYSEMSPWMRVSPTYCSCSQYGVSMYVSNAPTRAPFQFMRHMSASQGRSLANRARSANGYAVKTPCRSCTRSGSSPVVTSIWM